MFVPQIPGAPTVGNAIGAPVHQPPANQPPAPKKDDLPIQPPEMDFDRSVNYLADYSGCGHWRMAWPAQMLNAYQKCVIHSTTMMVLDERWYQHTKSVRIQRQATKQQLEFVKLLKSYQEKLGFKLMYEIDDVVFHEDIPDYNKFKSAFVDPQIRECSCAIMGLCDEITVTNRFMQQYYIEKTGNKNVTVIPNYPPKWWMGNFYSPDKVNRDWNKHKKKPRILYAASGAHFDVDNRCKQRDDFFHVNQAVLKTVNKYQWVFIGAFPLGLQSFVAQGKIEFHPWSNIIDYPSLVNDLDINMMVAPLQDNNFNKAKSDLKHIEACCYGLPIAAQNLCTYENAPYKFDTGSEMVDLIDECLKDEDSYMKISKESREVAEKRWLESEDNLGKYVELYNLPYKHEDRKLINSLEENR